MEQLLVQLGLNITASAVYDFLKSYKTVNPNATAQNLRSYITAQLNVVGADIKAEKIVEFFAKNGDISIENSNIFTKDVVHMQSSPNTKLVFGNGSVSATNKSKIDAGFGAFINAQGGSGIRQNEDGSISFFA